MLVNSIELDIRHVFGEAFTIKGSGVEPENKKKA